MELTNTQAIRDYLNQGTTRPVTSTELMEFYKACSTEERQQFGDEARKLLAA